MDYSQFLSQILMIVGVLVIFVNVITEVVKKLVEFKSAQTINVFVTVLSIVLTMGSFFAYWQIKSLSLTWYVIVAFAIVGFMVAYSAMFGFDKLLKYFEKQRCNMLIGHASINENKKARGGKAGDQTGKEVCTRSWYSKPWDVLLRCKDPNKAEVMAQSCEKGCANNHIGYDQNQRNTLRTEAQKVGWDLAKITVDCETDCSAFMTVCAESAGIPFTYTNAPTTSSMQLAFVKTGMFDALTDKKYLTSDKYLKRGDILVKKGSHTVMVLGNGVESDTFTLGETVRPNKSIDQLAEEVLKGYWMSGTTRKLLLEAAGYNYSEVQARVNEIVRGKK